MAISDNTLTLDADCKAEIIRALLLGLDAFGEVERLADGAELSDACGHGDIPDFLLARRVTADASGILVFAHALRLMHQS